ncbi:MAG: MFS transporter [Anaerolineales bacterium]
MSERNRSAALKLALICIPIFIGALDLTVVSAVLPHVIFDLEIPLDTGLDTAAWLVTGYLLAYTVSMTFMGRLSDLYGRQRVFLVALVIFAIGSYLVAVAAEWPTDLALRGYHLFFSGRPDLSYTSLYVLIAARMIQAFGAGSMVPVGMAMVGDLFPEGKRARPLGLIAAVDTAGWVVGHLYGGIVVRYFDWQTIFWLNLPICLVAYLLIARLLRSPERTAKGSMDWPGAILIAASLALLNLALGSGSESSSAAAFGEQATITQYVVPLLIAAAALFILFLVRQRMTKEPLVDLSLFRKLNFLPATLANLLLGVGMFIAIANVPLFINSFIAATPNEGAWESGWVLSALTVPMALAAIPGGWLAERRGYRVPLAVGVVLAVLGFSLMSTWTRTSDYWVMVPHLMLTGIGFGLSMAPVASAVVDAAPAWQRGTSSALVIVFRLVGMTVGVSGITTYGLRRFEALRAEAFSGGTDLSQGAQGGLQIMQQVIGETFWIAGGITALVLVAVLFLKPFYAKREGSNA